MRGRKHDGECGDLEKREKRDENHSPNDILKMVGFSDVVVRRYFPSDFPPTNTITWLSFLLRVCVSFPTRFRSLVWVDLIWIFRVICNLISSKSPLFLNDWITEYTSIWSMIYASLVICHCTNIRVALHNEKFELSAFGFRFCLRFPSIDDDPLLIFWQHARVTVSRAEKIRCSGAWLAFLHDENRREQGGV